VLSWLLRMPGWVWILLGLAGFPVAYYEAERIEAGKRMSIVLVPFYELGGRWAVFGALSAGALVMVAIGVLKYKHRRKPQPTPPAT
jgi:hypothetical protein